MKTKKTTPARVTNLLKNLPDVTFMTSPRTGQPVTNQLIIEGPDFEVFQSYDSIIAIKDLKTGQIYLDRSTWDYSRTTGKYRNEFLGENIQVTQKKIDNGTYILTDL